MKEYQGYCFEPLREEDIDILTPVMTRAFNEDARIHLNEEKRGPEGYDNGDFLRKWGLHPESEAYKILKEEEVIGCIIVWINRETGVNFLGNIFIDPSYQNQGVGKTVWEWVEKKYQGTKKWCTETAIYSRRNHNFYVNKCGFHIVRIDNPTDAMEGSYYMEKVLG